MTVDEKPKPAADKKNDQKPTADKNKEPEIPEEDVELVESLNLCVTRLVENQQVDQSLQLLKSLLKTSTSSMTSVPKPLKYLKPMQPQLVTLFESSKNKELADILSVLAMAFENVGDCLKYRFLGSMEDVGVWGHEYCRHLAAELINTFSSSSASEKPRLLTQAIELIPFFMKHNGEADACDLLIELEALQQICKFVDANNYNRVCTYILGCVMYVTPPDDVVILKVAHSIYLQQKQWASAVMVAIKLSDHDLVKSDFDTCDDLLIKKQLAYILARQQISVETEDEEILDILSNTKLSSHFLSLGKDLNVLEPKLPQDIYKSHLENTRPGFTTTVDSARQNLASTYVNAFINCGFQTDKLMTVEDGSWIYKNKDVGMLSATASLGVLNMWDVENGLSCIDKYLYSTDDYIKAGALLAIGLVSSGIKNESDPALALLSEQTNADKEIVRVASIMGLGIAYCGMQREEVLELLLPLVSDTGLTMEISAMAALSLGLVFTASCNGDICSTILQTFMERPDHELNSSFARLMAVSLGLLFFGKQDACDATIETLKVVENSVAEQTQVIVEVCAYAGTGNVLKIQKMLHYCNDHLVPAESGPNTTPVNAGAASEERPVKDSTFQAFAVIGLGMIAMGEEIGSQMLIRQFSHLMHYGEQVIRRAVPLSIGLLSASNPILTTLDLLSKYSHDHDAQVSQNAIFAMGLVGCGTNNARLAQMLRQLAAYYHKEPDHLFVVRLAQGMIHMSKGTVSINPFTTNRTQLSSRSSGSLFALLVALTEPKTFLHGNYHFILYLLAPSIYPRFLMTVDENGEQLPCLVRVGQAVDVVGQAGRPKTITGFQTHTTPVLLAYTERAELATDEYVACSNVLEGFIIVKKNSEAMDIDAKK